MTLVVQDELVKEGLTTLPVASCNLHFGGGAGGGGQ